MAKMNLSAAYNAMATPAQQQIDLQRLKHTDSWTIPLQVAESTNRAI